MANFRIAYLGNFSVPYSTESHIALSLEALGHTVLKIQEGETPTSSIADISCMFDADMFLWTQTYGLAQSGGDHLDRMSMLDQLRRSNIPSVGFHLDRWWGLDRQDQLEKEAFFRVEHLFTADGGHDEQWKALGINHHWLPPGVVHTEAVDGTSRTNFQCDIVFVGSWRHYGHEEWWPHRRELLRRVQQRYGRRFKMFPQRTAIRGMELTDLYASCKIAIGDSCLTGNPARYWSDRIPETLGRGALLIHPDVEGLRDIHPYLPVYERGNWQQFFRLIDYYLSAPDDREQLRSANAIHTREYHTYMQRMNTILAKVLT